MKKCAFILPYYGHFPNYFQLFLNSCAQNSDYDWLLFTDDHTQYEFPSNVKVHYESFKDMKLRAQKAFNFPINLEAPYKLCDYRPAYGLIFNEYLKEYRFWGPCDCDLIFGILDHFISENTLNEYDKIFIQGHCALYRNNSEINSAFRKKIGKKTLYKEVYTSSRAFTFDESYLPTNVNRVFIENGYKVFTQDLSANTDSRSSVFKLTHYDQGLGVYMTEKRLHAVYTWNKGFLSRSYFRLGEFVTHELMYIHLQRRPMKMDSGLEQANLYKILPGHFTALEFKEINKNNFKNIRWKEFNFHKIYILMGDIKFWWNRIIAKVFN